jgi:PEP-CTERM motif
MKSVVAMIALFCAGARAAPIIYTEQGTGSGSLGGTSFTNAFIMIVVTGDSAAAFTTIGSPGLFENIGTATVAVTGLGSATFTNQMVAFDSQLVDWAGIADHTHLDLLTLVTVNPLFANYSLADSIGPASGSTQINVGQSYPTTLGSFILNSVSGNSVFSATTVPEPAAFALLCVGIAGILAIHSRRR